MIETTGDVLWKPVFNNNRQHRVDDDRFKENAAALPYNYFMPTEVLLSLSKIFGKY